ncbi:MAG: aquaporin [Pseudomonadota bacterium]
MRIYAAEFIGTMILVLFGCGAAVIGQTSLGQDGVSLAFGLALIAGIYTLGGISGAHFNPAVSFAFFLTGRMGGKTMVFYWIAQGLGAIFGASVLALMVGLGNGLGENGWGPNFLAGYGFFSAAIFECVMTAIFVLVILALTQPAAPAGFAGLIIGLTLTGIHLVGFPITGVSVNPARSLGPALLVGGQALEQLWLFIAAPLAGAAIGAAVFRHIIAPAPVQTKITPTVAHVA